MSEAVSPGRLPQTLLYFVRLLRRAGLPAGPAQALDALTAVEAVGLERRDDLYWALHAVLVRRREERVIFDQAFHLFWRNPKLLERAFGLLLPALKLDAPGADDSQLAPRLADAMARQQAQPQSLPPEEQQQIDASLTFSAREILQSQDFEKMTAAEFEAAKLAVREMRLALPTLPTRRSHSAPYGRLPDMRASLKAMIRTGGDFTALRWRNPRHREVPLVVLCDISGSMARYSRLFLHFLHALTNDCHRVTSFVFGTRLTNITRALRHRDVDEAVERASAMVSDWSGGTRIGQTLADFNRLWARRVLGQGAIVLLVTDGLDRDGADGLATEAARLQRSCRRLIWLNPLLRFSGFEPKAQGIRALLPHVDEFRPVHTLNSLRDLSQALTAHISNRR
jgi:uncharacterized protein with von Willebrand factor type A (vWA) domain